MLTNPRDAFRG